MTWFKNFLMWIGFKFSPRKEFVSQEELWEWEKRLLDQVYNMHKDAKDTILLEAKQEIDKMLDLGRKVLASRGEAVVALDNFKAETRSALKKLEEKIETRGLIQHNFNNVLKEHMYRLECGEHTITAEIVKLKEEVGELGDKVEHHAMVRCKSNTNLKEEMERQVRGFSKDIHDLNCDNQALATELTRLKALGMGSLFYNEQKSNNSLEKSK